MRYAPIPDSLFADRRQQFSKRMLRDSIAIFYSNEPMPRNGDTHFPFRQDSDLFALSGLDQPETILVLFPATSIKSQKAIAFILPHDPRHAIWNGKRYTKQEASRISGIPSIHYLGAWNKVMKPILQSVRTIYLNTDLPKDHGGLRTLTERQASLLHQQYPLHQFRNAQPILASMMMIKHPLELDLMRQAIHVTGLAFQQVLQGVQPGMREFEVEAILHRCFTAHGCQHAFEPIVASGAAACILHYVRNQAIIKPETLLLLDFGAEYANMASDVSRTIPVSGRFTNRQRELYEAVLRILNEVMDLMRPGILLKELNTETGKIIDHELVRLRLVRKHEFKKQEKGHPLRLTYFMHGVSHHLGYDVHDKYDKSTPLRAGMVLTCEPGLYIREEKTGIRLENDILITRGKPRNLTEHIPIDPEEIESLMTQR